MLAGEYVNTRTPKKFQTEKSVISGKKLSCIIIRKKQSRQKQLLRKIVDLIPSQDRQICRARVLLGKPSNTVGRPVNRLYPLETNFKFVLEDFRGLKYKKL